MGIYVKGLAMPQGCEECRFSTDDCYGCRATLSVIEREKDEDRPKWCPLIDVSDHRALIDKDALYDQTAEWEAQALAQVKEYCGGESSWEQAEYRKWTTILSERSAFKFDVADAPVVILAEIE